MSIIDPETLASMSRREIYFNQLSADDRFNIISEVPKEYEASGLAGESTRALLGSVHGLIESGVGKALKHDPNKEFLYEPSDGINDFYAYSNIGKIASRFAVNDTSMSTFMVGRAYSHAAKKANVNGMPNVVYGFGAKTHNILKILHETNDSKWGELSEEDYLDAATSSGTSTRLSNSTMARSVWRSSNTVQLQEEHPSDEEIIAHRLDVDSDNSDDELVSPSSVVIDRHSDDYSDSDDRLDAAVLIENLPWDRLDERQTSVVHRISNGESLQSIGDDLGVSRERVRQINLKATSILRSGK